MKPRDLPDGAVTSRAIASPRVLTRRVAGGTDSVVVRRLIRGLLGVVVLGGTLAPTGVLAAQDPVEEVVAYLDGRQIDIEDVPRYYCDDFAYPVISCTRLPLVAQTRAITAALLADVSYVTIYDYASFAGTYMHVSQDYATLMTVGWNDRVSSFRARNSESGKFNADWFHTGALWLFCCNAQVPSLGAHDNTFSSVRRT